MGTCAAPSHPARPGPLPLPPFRPLAQKAEEQLDAAIAYKKSFLDGYLGKSALAQLRAKLAADYLTTPAK